MATVTRAGETSSWKCGNPARLQELADSLTTQDLLKCGQKWLAAFTPFITDKERKHAGCQHRLFFSQVEYCDNLIFHRREEQPMLTPSVLAFLVRDERGER